ncbi:MAG: flagellin [Bdellovibrionales bacterium RBG_16_40_8]|nr:MAG: flagellin [Bdellovibrionales bacterium RBG_16_40_8]
MGLRINTNIASIAAQRQLSKNQRRLEHSQASMSSGKRIINAADDAAGLAISESIRGQVGGLKMAKQNALNAQSLIQVSEGGLNEISNIMIRLRELGVQAASDNVSEVERGFLDLEAQQLVEESDRIAKSTRFGNKLLLDGQEDGEMEYHVGPYAGEENVIRAKVSADATADTLGISGASVADKDSAKELLGQVDEALIQIGKMRADFGSVQSRLIATNSNTEIQYENLSAAQSRIADADIAYESAEAASAQVLQQAAINVLAQANTNSMSAMKLIG